VFDEVIRRTKNIPIFGHPVYATADAAATHNDCACSEDHAKPTVDSAVNVGRVFKTYSVLGSVLFTHTTHTGTIERCLLHTIIIFGH